MKIKIEEAKNIAIKVLTKYGFTQEEAEYCTENCLEGELTGKKTHGFVRIPLLINSVKDGKIIVGGKDISINKETPVSLLLDGEGKTGLYVVNKALEMGIEKVKSSGMLIVGVTNTALLSGLIGQYARKASENDLIFIGFNNSPSRLIPYGTTKPILGTNPITLSAPTNDIPIILDISSSKITLGDVFVAISSNSTIPENTALDSEGNVTTNPEKAMEGGLLPYAEHKGSGMAFMVEILGGALTGSRCGYNVDGGWGSVFILIDPNILRPIDEFKNDVESLINEVKTSPKMKGFAEIYFPGEKSQKERRRNIETGEFELSDKIYEEIITLLNSN